MTKYKEYFERMITENKDIFDNFKVLHANYDLHGDKFQEEFNREGEKILALAHEWENRLCKTSEKAGYGGYTSNLAEKFQQELRSAFPLIDQVGIIVKKFTMPRIKILR